MCGACLGMGLIHLVGDVHGYEARSQSKLVGIVQTIPRLGYYIWPATPRSRCRVYVLTPLAVFDEGDAKVAISHHVRCHCHLSQFSTLIYRIF